MFQGGYGEDTLFCDSNKWGVSAARWKFQGKGPQLLLSQTWEI